MRPNSQSTATLDDGRITIWGGCLFLPLIFHEDFFFFVESSIREGLIFSRSKSCFFLCVRFKRLINRLYLVIGKDCISRIRN